MWTLSIRKKQARVPASEMTAEAAEEARWGQGWRKSPAGNDLGPAVVG